MKILSQKVKSCRVCGADFRAEGNKRTCSPECSAAHRSREERRWREEHRDHRQAYNARPDVLERQRLASKRRYAAQHPATHRRCTMCEASFLAAGRGRRVALTCSAECQRQMELARKRAKPKDHPVRKSAVANARRWRENNRERSNECQRKALRRRRQDLSDVYVLNLLTKDGVAPRDALRPLVPAKRAQLTLKRELRRRGDDA